MDDRKVQNLEKMISDARSNVSTCIVIGELVCKNIVMSMNKLEHEECLC